MDYATSRGQDEVSVLARLRARQPFDVLDYKLPRTPAGQVVGFAAMVSIHPVTCGSGVSILGSRY